MRRHEIRTLLVLAACLWVASEGRVAAQGYLADPDPDRPMLHQHPPALTPIPPGAQPAVPTGSVNGISFIDVLVASGFDLSGSDLGNEPALTINPLNPDQIVLTSFSGSNWPSGGNSSLFYSADGGATWAYSLSLPPPTGTTTPYGCPCDQTMDWGRDGVLYATFLHYSSGTFVASVYSAQTTTPTVPGSWTYRTNGGIAERTNLDVLTYVDQPWLWSGPLPGDNSLTNVCVAYDNFNSSYTFTETRAADSPANDPLEFTEDEATGLDGQQYNDSINPGHRISVGPDGTIFNVYQRLVAELPSNVKRITYLVTASTDGGQTWFAANSDHASGAKIVAASVYSFQGNGAKVGGVNALLGGIDAIAVDPSDGTAWIVYGARATETARDRLFLVPVTLSAGSLIVGTARAISPATSSAYLPAVAVLPSGEVGVLFVTYTGTSFAWNFVQTTDGGATLVKQTTLPSFTSPFSNNGSSNQRILGDFVQLRAVGCSFYGTYPARGEAGNAFSSIDPYFMNAPAATACALPTLIDLDPDALCAGRSSAALTLQGTGFANGANGRIDGLLRKTTFLSPTQLSAELQSADLATPGSATIDVLGAPAAGGLTTSLPLSIETPAASPGASLLLDKRGSDVQLDWTAAAGATSYRVERCAATSGPCSPATTATPMTSDYQETTLGDGEDYWYRVESVNSCGSVP